MMLSGLPGRSAVLSYALLVLSACVSDPLIDPAATSFNADQDVHGTSSTPANCRAGQNSIWAMADGAGECIRYYPAGLSSGSNKAMVYFTGDIGQFDIWSAYNSLTPATMQADSRKWHDKFALPYVLMARPGTFGSSGNHFEQRRVGKEGRLLNAALDILKNKYGIKEFALAGQSGGGHVVAQLLTLRDDVACGVMASAPLNYQDEIKKDFAGFSDLRFRLRKSWDPIDHMADIRPTKKRRIFILGDPKDKIVDFDGQKKYRDLAVKRGINVRLIATHATGDLHHGLADQAKNAAANCLKGLSGKEIADFTNRHKKIVEKSMQEGTGPVIASGKARARAYAGNIMSGTCGNLFRNYISKIWHAEVGAFAYSKGGRSEQACAWVLQDNRKNALEGALYACEDGRVGHENLLPDYCRIFAVKDDIVWRK